MTMSKVEKIIWQEIRKRDISFYDMINFSGFVVDSNPNDKNSGTRDTRRNKFKQAFGSERMKELLSLGDCHQYDDYPPLKISFQDLFNFWFEECIEDRHLFADEILDDIYDYFTEQMRPKVNKTEVMDVSLDFEEVPLQIIKQRKAA